MRLHTLSLVLVCAASLATPTSAQTTRPAAADQQLSVGFLTLEGVYNSELMAPWDIFQHTIFHTKPGMKVFTVGRQAGTITSFEGLRIGIDYSLEASPPIDVLVVPSAVDNMTTDLEDERLIQWVADRGKKARCVMSICDGAFLLAEAGLLEGRRCTTFPGDIAAFRKRYRQLDVVDGVSFVADGPMITGVGGARSYDPAFFLVDELYGETVARGVGRGMVIPWDRERVRHLAMPATMPSCYLPGDRIDPGVTVETPDGQSITLADVVAKHPDTKAVILTLIAGGEAKPSAKRGDFWCEDSFNEIPNLRYLNLNYRERGVLFVAVFCPPVHHETKFGYDTGSFLTRPPDDPVYQSNKAAFVKSTMALVDNHDLPFDEVVFDPRFRLLSDPARTQVTKAAGPFPIWQGKFKWFQDSQTYGTPTSWLLTGGLEVATTPFFMNVYESEGRKLRFSAHDMAQALERALQ